MRLPLRFLKSRIKTCVVVYVTELFFLWENNKNRLSPKFLKA
jgi:hypothetical protein